MQVLKNLSVLILLATFLSTCVDAVRPEFRFRDGFILVDGEVSSVAGSSRLNLNETELVGRNYRLTPYEAAVVQTIDGVGNVVNWFRVDDTDDYRPPADFVGEIGQSYYVRIVTPNGEVIESIPEIMPEVIPLEDVRIRFAQEAYFSDEMNRFIPAFRLLVDFTDPAGERNFYRWRYFIWETIGICLSCDGGFYNQALMECVPFLAPTFRPRTDYQCLGGNCFERVFNNDFSIFSDEFVDGNPLTGLEVGRIDFNRLGGLLVVVDHQVLTEEAFEFNQTINDLTEGSGGLNATLPAALDGNVNAMDENGPPVLGYFGVVAASSDRAYIDRDTVTGSPLPFDSRWFLDVPPPPGVEYFHPCEGANRTNEVPEGWGG